MTEKGKRIFPDDATMAEQVEWLDHELLSICSMSDQNLHMLSQTGVLTVEFVDAFVRYFETLFIQDGLHSLHIDLKPPMFMQQHVADASDVIMLNRLPYGYTTGDLRGGQFMNSSFDPAQLPQKLDDVRLSNLSDYSKGVVGTNLRVNTLYGCSLDPERLDGKLQALSALELDEAKEKQIGTNLRVNALYGCSLDPERLDGKLQALSALELDEPKEKQIGTNLRVNALYGCGLDPERLDGKLQALSALGLDEPTEKKIGTNLKVNAAYGCSLDRKRHAGALLTLEALGVDRTQVQKVSDNFMKTASICFSTKMGANMMAAAAITPEDHRQVASAMSKLSRPTNLDVLPEETPAVVLFEELQEHMPALSVLVPDRGKIWLDSTPPEKKDRIVLRGWLTELGMPEVTERLNLLFGQKNTPWHHLIRPFSQAVLAFNQAIGKRKRERENAGELQPAAEGSMKDDAICPASSGMDGGSASKKSRATARCFTATETRELESLLTAGKLTSLLSRQTEALRMSTNSGNKLTVEQVTSWIRRHKVALKKNS